MSVMDVALIVGSRFCEHNNRHVIVDVTYENT